MIDKTFHIGSIYTEKEKTKAIVGLSMILSFFDEIHKNARNKWYTESFANLTKKLMWVLSHIDPKLDHPEFYENGDRLYNEMCQKF